MTHIFLDTETTGLDANARILSIAFKVVEKDYAFYSVVKPKGDFKDTGQAIHKLTPQEIAKGADLEVVLQDLSSHIEEGTCIIGHNIAYDRKVLEHEIKEHKLGVLADKLLKVKWVCTLQLARTRLPKLESHKLPDVYFALFGKGFDGAHNAMSDVEACAKCYAKLQAPVADTFEIIYTEMTCFHRNFLVTKIFHEEKAHCVVCNAKLGIQLFGCPVMFGKYKGKQLVEVLAKDWRYVKDFLMEKLPQKTRERGARLIRWT